CGGGHRPGQSAGLHGAVGAAPPGRIVTAATFSAATVYPGAACPAERRIGPGRVVAGVEREAAECRGAQGARRRARTIARRKAVFLRARRRAQRVPAALRGERAGGGTHWRCE